MGKIVKLLSVFLSTYSLALFAYTPSPYLVYLNEIISQFTPEIENEFNVSYSGSGGEMPYDVASVGVDFTAYRKGSVQEAREFEVKTIEKLTAMINNHEKIRPFLREYPFPNNRVTICISYINTKDHDFYSDGSVAYASSVNGNVFYRANDKLTEKFIDIGKESYEEAVSIVNKESNFSTKL